MTAISVFNGAFCDAEAVVKKVLDITGYQLVTDDEIIADAAGLSGMDEKVLAHAFETEADNREELISWLRYATAERLAGEGNLVFWGHTALLLPQEIGHILRVCLISEMDDRLATAVRDARLSEGSALERIKADDRARGEWTIAVTECNDPWAEELYDLVIPVDSIGIRRSACVVVEQLANALVQESEFSRDGVKDFLLESKIQAALVGKGHAVSVSSRRRSLKLRFIDHDKMLKDATRKLSESVCSMDGVKSVEVGVGRRYNPGDVYQLARGQGASPNRLEGIGGGKFANGYDLEMAAMVQNFLDEEGYDISVFANSGAVSLTINDHKRMLERVSRSISEFVSGFDDVKNVEIGIGREYHQAEAYGAMRRKKSRMLLADADRKFIRTLSPRLRRDAGMANFTFSDGEDVVRERQADVIVLNMPRLDDTEQLRRIKEEHPQSEVLVLTDQKSETESETCRRMGVFASIPKPVNTAKLNTTIRAASQKKRTYLFP